MNTDVNVCVSYWCTLWQTDRQTDRPVRNMWCRLWDGRQLRCLVDISKVSLQTYLDSYTVRPNNEDSNRHVTNDFRFKWRKSPKAYFASDVGDLRNLIWEILRHVTRRVFVVSYVLPCAGWGNISSTKPPYYGPWVGILHADD